MAQDSEQETLPKDRLWHLGGDRTAMWPLGKLLSLLCVPEILLPPKPPASVPPEGDVVLDHARSGVIDELFLFSTAHVGIHTTNSGLFEIPRLHRMIIGLPFDFCSNESRAHILRDGNSSDRIGIFADFESLHDANCWSALARHSPLVCASSYFCHHLFIIPPTLRQAFGKKDHHRVLGVLSFHATYSC